MSERVPTRNHLHMLCVCAALLLLACTSSSQGAPNAQTAKPAAGADKSDLIRVETPSVGAQVQSPLRVTGQARGTWFFEASFPIQLLDAHGHMLVQKPAQAKGEWMTETFVPFEVELEFAQPSTPEGTLVLQKDNPSGLPEHADELRIPVRFAAP